MYFPTTFLHPSLTAPSPWYRTVLRGMGFQLRPSDFSHPTIKTRSKTFVPPMAPMSAPIRRDSRWVMDRGINLLIRGTREHGRAPGSLPRERKTNTSAGSSNSLPLLAWLFIRNNFVRTVFTTCTFPKKPHKTHSHIEAVLRGSFLPLKTCTIKLNTVIKLHNNVKQKRVMQIIKTNKDIAVISVCVSVCVCQQKHTEHFNDFWPWGLRRKVFLVCPSLWMIIQLSLLKKLRNSLSPQSCQANSAAVY